MRTDVAQLNYLHKTLRELLVWLERTTGLEFTETSSWRPHDDGVHGTSPVRGYDVRMRSETIGQAVADHINDAREYDPGRPDLACAVLHGEASNVHLHIQVHGNTRRL